MDARRRDRHISPSLGVPVARRACSHRGGTAAVDCGGEATAMKPSWDDKNLAAVLLPCARCGQPYFVTVPREGWICRACADKVRTR